MGLFSFIKEAGLKLLGKSEEEELKKQADAAALQAKKDEMLAKAMLKACADHNLPVTNPVVIVKGDTVTVSGIVPSQEIKEKILLVLGNVNGIATVEENITVDAPEPEARFYTVVSGDNLSKISNAHYGTPNKYMVIFEANKPMLKEPDLIYPGQMLRIPNIDVVA